MTAVDVCGIAIYIGDPHLHAQTDGIQTATRRLLLVRREIAGVYRPPEHDIYRMATRLSLQTVHHSTLVMLPIHGWGSHLAAAAYVVASLASAASSPSALGRFPPPVADDVCCSMVTVVIA